MNQLIPPPNYPIDVKSFGATGDGATDDRAAIILALASAMASGLPLYFPDGTYTISGYIDIYGARNLRIYGSGNATLLYPSDNTALVADGIALTSAMARSALLMRHCQGTLIERLRFQGGESRDVDVENVGSGVFEKFCQKTTIRGCCQLFGGSLHRQDAQTDTTGTGDSMAVSNGMVTLTDSKGDFTPGDVGLQLTVSGCTNPANNGVFTAASYLATGTITCGSNLSATDGDSVTIDVGIGAAAVFEYDRSANGVAGGHVVWAAGPTAASNATALRLLILAAFPQLSVADNLAGVLTITNAIGDVTLTKSGAGAVSSIVSNSTVLVYVNADAVNETSSFTWMVRNRDTGTLIDGCEQDRAHHVNTLGSNSVVRNCTFRWPTESYDMCGVGDSLTLAGTTLTLTDQAARFLPSYHNKWIMIAGATTAANNTTVPVQITYISSTQVSWTNASGVTELYAGEWWIINGDKTGLGNGAGALTKVGSVMTLTASAPAFTASDLHKSLLIRLATTAANSAHSAVTAVLSPTQIQFTLANGVAEDFSGVWTLDDFDESGSAGSATGSTHAFYLFAGRHDIIFDGCQFIGNRTTCIKISGSAFPIRDIQIRNCVAIECCALTVAGADDAQEHTGISVVGCTLIDCGQVGRRGQLSNPAIWFLGASNVLIANNQFHYTHASIFHASGGSTGGLYAIQCGRYVDGISQPLDGVTITGNIFTYDHAAILLGRHICQDVMHLTDVGLGAKYGTGTLTRTTFTATAAASTDLFTKTAHGLTTGDGPIRLTTTGALPNPTALATDYYAIRVSANTFKIATSFANAMAGTSIDLTSDSTPTLTVTTPKMTLTDTAASFLASSDVGKPVTIALAPDSGNNVTRTIESVDPSKTKISFTNASGVSNASAGTYRIPPRPGAGGGLVVTNNQIHGTGLCGIRLLNDVGPLVADNIFDGLETSIFVDGCSAPVIANNKLLGAAALQPQLRLDGGTTWPIVYGNTPTNAAIGARSNRGWDIGVDNPTVRDYPLLGFSGRARPTNAQQEIVVAFGAKHVDGDTINVNGTMYTYKGAATSGAQFDSFAKLVGLIQLQPGFECADYGTGYSAGDVPTQHVRIRSKSQTATPDGAFFVRVSALNPTALVVLPNGAPPNTQCLSRGAGSPGPIADKTVLWSPCCSFSGVPQLIADNADARTVLADGSYATGLITCVAKANVTAGVTDHVTIGDGVQGPKTYYFDTVGAGGGSGIQVDVSTDTTAAQCAARLRTAILANQAALSVVDHADGTLSITHRIAGALGNVTITEAVANAGFLVAGLTGGDHGGWHPVKTANDSGCCEVIKHAKESGSPEFRWKY